MFTYPRLWIVSLCFLPSPLLAQDNVWTQGLATARQQARTLNRPIVVDFGTENCFWCKQLHNTTFRDAAVVAVLKGRFVAVQVDADKEPRLAQELQIQSYPTLVFMAPDGKVLGRHVGYVDAAKFSQQLQRALRESGLADAPTPSVAQVRTTVHPAAAGEAEHGPAQILLAQARLDFEDRLYAGCLECCQRLLTRYPEAPQAAAARQLVVAVQGHANELQATLNQLGTATAQEQGLPKRVIRAVAP